MDFTHGLVVKRFSGALATRVIDRAGCTIEAHAHDWPVLSLYRLGGYVNETDLGTRTIETPSAVLYRARASHANQAERDGFEQIEVEFDPEWLGERLPDKPIVHIASGELVQFMHRLSQAWEVEDDEIALKALTAQFVRRLGRIDLEHRPGWIADIHKSLRESPETSVKALAARTARSPAWVGAEYRRWTGETIRHASSRLRVSKAAMLLRETNESPATIAIAAGFCDQSHMIRSFMRVLGRTPHQVRLERSMIRDSKSVQ